MNDQELDARISEWTQKLLSSQLALSTAEQALANAIAAGGNHRFRLEQHVRASRMHHQDCSTKLSALEAEQTRRKLLAKKPVLLSKMLKVERAAKAHMTIA